MSEGIIPEIKIESVEESKQGAKSEVGSLGEEFKVFGSNLLTAVRSVAQSEEVRQLGSQIVDSLRDIGEEIQETVQQAKEKDEVKAVSEQAKRVSNSVGANVREGSITHELQTSLSKALHTLNTELNKIIDQIQARTMRANQDVESSAKEASHEPQSDPATAKTERLEEKAR